MTRNTGNRYDWFAETVEYPTAVVRIAAKMHGTDESFKFFVRIGAATAPNIAGMMLSKAGDN